MDWSAVGLLMVLAVYSVSVDSLVSSGAEV